MISSSSLKSTSTPLGILLTYSCRQFNYPGDGMYAFAEGLEAAYWKEWPRAAANKLLPNEKKELLGLLNKSLKEPISLLFREAGKSWWKSLYSALIIP